MAKEKIILLEGDDLIYTLGAISDDSNEVMTIRFPLYKSGGSSSFNQKDLVSVMFDKNYFNLLTNFDIRTVKDLKKLTQPSQPYKLKIGSSVRYKNNSYDVIGLYFNTFAQQNIVSPILFNPTDLINDVKSLLFGLKENDEIIKIINDNLNEGKYSENVIFPYLASVTNYKEYLSKVVEPPFTTLDSIKVEQKKTSSVGSEIIPNEFPSFQVDFDKSINEIEIVYNNSGSPLDTIYSKDDFSDLKAKSFFEVFEKSKLYKNVNYIKTNTKYYLKDDLKLNLPYDYFNLFDKSEEAKDLLFDTPQGKIPPLVRLISTDNLRTIGSNDLNLVNQESLFGVLYDENGNTQLNEVDRFYNIIFQNKSVYVGFEKDLAYQKGDGFYRNFPSSPSKRNFANEVRILTLKEDSYYGDFFNSSGSPLMNSTNNNKILPFGSIVKMSGIWWYVIKYFATDINDLENLNKCLCIKATSRDSVLKFNLDVYSLSEKKGKIRVYDTEKIYKASIKNSHIFKFPANFFSSPQKGVVITEESKSKDGIVTELFYEKRKEQVDLLKNNFPELSDTFFGILTVLDKKLRKPKDEKKSINTENSIYCIMKDSFSESRFFQSLSDDFAKKISEDLDVENIKKNIDLFLPRTKISQKIIDIALGSSVIYFKPNIDSNLYFSLNNLEEYQKMYVMRTLFDFVQGVICHKAVIFEEQLAGKVQNGLFLKHPYNTLNTFSKNNFLSSLSNYAFEFSNFKNTLEIRSVTNGKTETSFLNEIINKENYLGFSNYLFVFQVIKNLTKHIQEVALLHLTDGFEEKIKQHPLVKMYKNFDLNTQIGFFKQYHLSTSLDVTIKADVFTNDDIKKNLYQAFENSNSKLTPQMLDFIFEKSWRGRLEFITDSKGDEGVKERTMLLGIFLSFIKILDTVYNFELDLTNKIKVRNNKFLEEFPIEPTDEDLSEDEFDDSDIFSEALEDLGDEFLEEIESVDITDF